MLCGTGNSLCCVEEVCYARIKAQQTEPVAINIFGENQSRKNPQLFIHK